MCQGMTSLVQFSGKDSACGDDKLADGDGLDDVNKMQENIDIVETWRYLVCLTYNWR